MRHLWHWALAAATATAACGDGLLRDKSDAFFAANAVVRLRVELAPAEYERLKNDNRHYVRATLKEEGGKDYGVVGVKMKGAAGSFRPLDQRPALTLQMNKFGDKQRFHDLEKFHLNNSEQDPTRLHEILGGEACRAAGVPTPRGTHARVWLNGRDLGLYVLKEGFDKRFLRRHFPDATGNLYDGGFCQDIDAALALETGKGAGDRKDLQSLAEACRLPNPRERWAKMAERIDMDAFHRLMALERLLSHWDGYAQNSNNYRLYFDPARGGKAVFFTHGMDQLFGDPGYALQIHARPMVARAVFQCDAFRKRYGEVLREVAGSFLDPAARLKRIDELAPRVRAALAETDKNQAKEFDNQVKELKERIKQRAEHVKRLLAEPDPSIERFDAQGIAVLRDWWGAAEGEEPKVEEAVPPGEKEKTYMVQAGPKGNCAGSWRRTVLLGRGKYRLEGRVRTEKVVALEDGPGSAAGLRLVEGGRNVRIDGTHGWKPLSIDFEVLEDRREVEFTAEVRCKSGRAWFDKNGFRLAKRP